jgi:hypothetical protein
MGMDLEGAGGYFRWTAEGWGTSSSWPNNMVGLQFERGHLEARENQSEGEHTTRAAVSSSAPDDVL